MKNIELLFSKTSSIISAIADYLSVADKEVASSPLKIVHTESNLGNYVRLQIYTHKLPREHVRVSRKLNNLTIEMLTQASDSVIYHEAIGHKPASSDGDQDSLASQFGRIRWSSSSAQEITSFLRYLLGHTRPSEDFWEARAARLIRITVTALVELRDAGHLRLSLGEFMKHLFLDEIYKLSTDERLSPSALEGLSTILNEMPGFRAEDARDNCINQNAIAHQGYLIMAIIESFSRLLPPPVDTHEYEIRAPFSRITAKIIPDGLLIQIFYHSEQETIPLEI